MQLRFPALSAAVSHSCSQTPWDSLCGYPILLLFGLSHTHAARCGRRIVNSWKLLAVCSPLESLLDLLAQDLLSQRLTLIRMRRPTLLPVLQTTAAGHQGFLGTPLPPCLHHAIQNHGHRECPNTNEHVAHLLLAG